MKLAFYSKPIHLCIPGTERRLGPQHRPYNVHELMDGIHEVSSLWARFPTTCTHWFITAHREPGRHLALLTHFANSQYDSLGDKEK